MVKSTVNGDIFKTTDKHIIFGLNIEGFNDSGFAVRVANLGFDEIRCTGGNELGEVLSKEIDGVTYHGIVCHSLHNGWGYSPQIILDALNYMDFEDDASIVFIGTGMIGRVAGAPAKQIYEAFKMCNKNLNVYYC